MSEPIQESILKICSYYCEKVTLGSLLRKQYPDIQFTVDAVTGCKDLSIERNSYELLEITVERNTLAMNALVDLMETSNAFRFNGYRYETLSMQCIQTLLSEEVIVPFTFVEQK